MFGQPPALAVLMFARTVSAVFVRGRRGEGLAERRQKTAFPSCGQRGPCGPLPAIVPDGGNRHQGSRCNRASGSWTRSRCPRKPSQAGGRRRRGGPGGVAGRGRRRGSPGWSGGGGSPPAGPRRRGARRRGSVAGRGSVAVGPGARRRCTGQRFARRGAGRERPGGRSPGHGYPWSAADRGTRRSGSTAAAGQEQGGQRGQQGDDPAPR
jgi:hypothetical protein